LIRFLDSQRVWGEIRKSFATGARSFSEYGDGSKLPVRITKNKHLIFQFGVDGHWRWVATMGD
jgi:hypothetical protein